MAIGWTISTVNKKKFVQIIASLEVAKV